MLSQTEKRILWSILRNSNDPTFLERESDPFRTLPTRKPDVIRNELRQENSMLASALSSIREAETTLKALRKRRDGPYSAPTPEIRRELQVAVWEMERELRRANRLATISRGKIERLTQELARATQAVNREQEGALEYEFETDPLHAQVAGICGKAKELARFFGKKSRKAGRGVPQLNNLVNQALKLLPELNRERDIDTLVGCVASVESATGNRGAAGRLRDAAFRRLAELRPK